MHATPIKENHTCHVMSCQVISQIPYKRMLEVCHLDAKLDPIHISCQTLHQCPSHHFAHQILELAGIRIAGGVHKLSYFCKIQSEIIDIVVTMEVQSTCMLGPPVQRTVYYLQCNQ